MSATVNLLVGLVMGLNLLALGSGRLPALIRTVSLQGMALGLMPLLIETDFNWLVAAVAVGTVAGKGFLIPHLLRRAMRAANIDREVEPFIGFVPSLLLGAGGTIAAVAITGELPLLPEHAGSLLVAGAMASVLTGFTLLIGRAKAVAQVCGYLILENGIYLFGLLLIRATPLLVEAGILLDGGSHQGDCRVVLIKPAVVKLLRYRIGWSEVHHVERPDGDHLRDAGYPGGLEAVRAGRKHPAGQFVCKFRGGDVDHAANEPVPDQLLHRLPARPGCMKHQDLEAGFFEQFPHPVHTRSRDAEHRRAEHRIALLAFGAGHRQAAHSGDGICRVGEDAAREAIQPGEVSHRIKHRDIRDADVRTSIARGQR